jgi:hypothetical protein
MNERIRELAEQAGYTPDMFGVGHWDMPECKKFAELIVRECCDLIMKNQYNMVPGFMERMSAYSEVCMLKKHFGVNQ